MGWIAEGLAAILEHRDARETLGLLPRAKKRPADPQRGWDIAMWIDAAEKLGYSRATAVKLAADAFHTDDSNVRKLIKNSPEWINPNKDWDEYFTLRSRPLPPAKTGKK